MSYIITLDRGLKNAVPPLPAITTLKAWEAEGKIEIFEADRAKEPAITQGGWPGQAQTAIIGKPRSNRGRPTSRKNSGSSSTFGQVSSVLFPQFNVQKLNMAQINNVTHLIQHQSQGHSIFVTCNMRDFIEQGKRERLQTAFKIVVMTPDEVVALLKEAEGWNPTDKNNREGRSR